MREKLAIVVGAGPGNGLAFGRKFYAEGYQVSLLSRSADNLEQLRRVLPDAHYDRCDVTQPQEIHRAVGSIHDQWGPVDTLIYNAGAGAFGSIDEITAEQFEHAWRVNALGCLHCVRQVLSGMYDAGRGNIVVIGATASVRGGAGFAAFSSAKGAQRNLVQSLARHVGPRGIHVAYVVIDGVIDMQRTRQYFHDKPDDFFLQPDAIAETVFCLTQQPPSAWTFELDLRPYGERW